jgi:hypothetical protein
MAIAQFFKKDPHTWLQRLQLWRAEERR